jgi:hypothetical protein
MNSATGILRRLFIALILGSSLGASVAAGQTLFSEDFESDLSQWVGKSEGAHSGLIVLDPLRPGNAVLTFSAITIAGDAFGTAETVTPGQTYILEFEYLGLPGMGTPGNLGGFIGFAEDTPSSHRWLTATVVSGGSEDDSLIDDGQWRAYSIEFDPYNVPPRACCYDGIPTNDTIRVMVEDWQYAGGVAGDIFFDNIRLSVAVLEVNIDIKPGSDPNSVNQGSSGVIPVAVLSTADFDAPAEIDPDTISLAGARVKMVGKSSKLLCHSEDVNEDALADLVCKVETAQFMIEVGDSVAVLEADTFGGASVRGEDSIRIVP